MTQQQVKALEEEARTRIQADEVRATRFRQAVERVSDEVQGLAARLGAEENSTSQRVAILEVYLDRVFPNPSPNPNSNRNRTTATDTFLFYMWLLGKEGRCMVKPKNTLPRDNLKLTALDTCLASTTNIPTQKTSNCQASVKGRPISRLVAHNDVGIYV